MRKAVAAVLAVGGMGIALLTVPAPSSAAPSWQEKATCGCVSSCKKASVDTDKTDDNSAFVSKDWKPDGYLIGDVDHKAMISTGDVVYIDIGSDRVQPGSRCGVYSDQGESQDPGTRKSAGNEITRVGTLEVTDAGEKSSTARVIHSSAPLEAGDGVKVDQTKP